MRATRDSVATRARLHAGQGYQFILWSTRISRREQPEWGKACTQAAQAKTQRPRAAAHHTGTQRLVGIGSPFLKLTPPNWTDILSLRLRFIKLCRWQVLVVRHCWCHCMATHYIDWQMATIHDIHFHVWRQVQYYRQNTMMEEDELGRCPERWQPGFMTINYGSPNEV